MACARHLDLHSVPIVCVNVDGYYEPFRAMLRKAWADELIHLPPDRIVRFADGAEDAVRFVEGLWTENEENEEEGTIATSGAAAASEDRTNARGDHHRSSWGMLALAFVAGAASGIAIAGSRAGRR